MNPSNEAHPFESLRFDVLWRADIYFDVFDALARLSVVADEAGPTASQRDAFDQFRVAEHAIKPRVYEAVLAHYQSVVDDYRAQFQPEYLHLAPLVTDAADVRRLLTPEAVHIRELGPGEREVGLLFGCTWADSHGVGVRLVDGEVAQVGPQDECL
jgi:hypothetical protein